MTLLTFLPVHPYIVSVVFIACTLFAGYLWSSRSGLVDGFELALGPKDGVSPKEAEKAFAQRALSILRSGAQKVLPVLPCYT